MAEGDYELAAQRLVYARDAEPSNVAVLRLMTLAFWQAGNLDAAGRAVRDWARVEGERPAPHRFAAASTRTWARSSWRPRRPSAPRRARPQDADAWERARSPAAAPDGSRGRIDALEHARRLGPSVEGLLDLALAYHLAGDLGGEVTATEQATLIDARIGRLPGRATRMRSRGPTGFATRSPLPSARCDLDSDDRDRRAAGAAAPGAPPRPARRLASRSSRRWLRPRSLACRSTRRSCVLARRRSSAPGSGAAPRAGGAPPEALRRLG